MVAPGKQIQQEFNMFRTKFNHVPASIALATAIASLSFAQASYADSDEWNFGIGTGLNSLALDGDIGFAGEDGGVIPEIDLDNGDTMDMLESAFGFGAFANKGPLTINMSYGTLKLEDEDSGLDAKWDRTQARLEVGYRFAITGNHRWGVVGGVHYTEHEWDLKDKSTGFKTKPEDDWTDAVVGLTHRVPITTNWAWANRVEYGFGDSEGTLGAKTSIVWKPLEHWVFDGSLAYYSVEYGDKGDINKPDFYYYEVDETYIGLAFSYVW
jgi:hypothetical protein